MKFPGIFFIIAILALSAQLFSQPINVDSIYKVSMDLYKAEKFSDAANAYNKIYDSKKFELAELYLYDGACIFALNGNNEKAFEILDYLVTKKFYSNYEHITTDTDLKNLYTYTKWREITNKVKENEQRLVDKIKARIKPELLKAKQILAEDNGNLWGVPIPSTYLIVMMGNTIYSLQPLPDSKTTDSVIFYKEVPENTFAPSNTTQVYNGEEYATVLSSYLSDSSATIIHELFHVLQNKNISLNGGQIDYLDEYDAREWLRLEYQALRNCLRAINNNADRNTILLYINDAFTYRKIRQTRYKSFLKEEIEIETLEGMANYTGYKLSTYPDKYEIAINDINIREHADTYTRPFPYATGPAYGLIFDYMGLNWRTGLNKVYNFLDIYETLFLKDSLIVHNDELDAMNERNNYKQIHEEESKRKETAEKNISYYNELFFGKPTLSVVLKDKFYGLSYDMNGTVVLKDKGIVYSRVTGKDGSGNNFGNFKTLPGKEKLGFSGVLMSSKEKKFVFPKPIKIEENKITGETYEIELNKGWIVKTINDKGDMEIIKDIK